MIVYDLYDAEGSLVLVSPCLDYVGRTQQRRNARSPGRYWTGAARWVKAPSADAALPTQQAAGDGPESSPSASPALR